MKSDEKENDLRLVFTLVSGLSTQNVTWFSSVIQDHISATQPLYLYKDGVSNGFTNVHWYGTSYWSENYTSIAGKISGAIDLTNYNKICWYTSNSASKANVVYVSSSNTYASVCGAYVAVGSADGSGSVDITGLSGKYYIFVGAFQDGVTTDCNSVTDCDTYYKVTNTVSKITSYFDRVWVGF